MWATACFAQLHAPRLRLGSFYYKSQKCQLQTLRLCLKYTTSTMKHLKRRVSWRDMKDSTTKTQTSREIKIVPALIVGSLLISFWWYLTLMGKKTRHVDCVRGKVAVQWITSHPFHLLMFLFRRQIHSLSSSRSHTCSRCFLPFSDRIKFSLSVCLSVSLFLFTCFLPLMGFAYRKKRWKSLG